MKKIISIIMITALTIISGCSKRESDIIDDISAPVEERVYVNDEKTVTSRIRHVSKKQKNCREIFNAESGLDIRDVLNDEKEFLVFDDWNTTTIYVYAFTSTGYEKYTYYANYDEQDTIVFEHQDNITGMYVLCPEYTNVEAITKAYSDSADSTSINEYDLYIVDKEEAGLEIVGGNLRYRIFKVDAMPGDNAYFEICNALALDNPEVYGGFTIKFE